MHCVDAVGDFLFELDLVENNIIILIIYYIGFAMVLRYSEILGRGLDDIFYCWARVKSDLRGIEERFVVCRASDLWRFSGDQSVYTRFISSYIKPAGYITVSLRSREVFRNGLFELRTPLPRWDGGPMLWFGFESEDLFGGGCIHFMWDSGKGVLKAFAGGFVSRAEMDLTRFLPNNPSEAYNIYRISFNKDLALWYINERLRAIAVFGEGDNRDSRIIYDDAPYIISFVRDRPSPELGVLLDIDGGDISKTYIWEGIHPWSLRVSSGTDNMNIYLDLYIERSDRRLAGIETGDKIVSAPFPGISGFKKISFRSSGEGVLYIEEWDESVWGLYDKIRVEGGEKTNIYIDSWRRALLYRIIYEPHTRSSIEEARVILG
ncbi:MAG: hypothetical protein QXQ57_04115 [Sulfolobales archaeon]